MHFRTFIAGKGSTRISRISTYYKLTNKISEIIFGKKYEINVKIVA